MTYHGDNLLRVPMHKSLWDSVEGKKLNKLLWLLDSLLNNKQIVVMLR